MGIVIEPTNPDLLKQRALDSKPVKLYMTRTDVRELLKIAPDTPLIGHSRQQAFTLPEPGEFITVHPIDARNLISSCFVVIDGRSVSYLATEDMGGGALAGAIRERAAAGKSLDAKMVLADAALSQLGAAELLALLKEKGIEVAAPQEVSAAPEVQETPAPVRKSTKKESEE